jgi:hypothetical protein
MEKGLIQVILGIPEWWGVIFKEFSGCSTSFRFKRVIFEIFWAERPGLFF